MIPILSEIFKLIGHRTAWLLCFFVLVVAGCAQKTPQASDADVARYAYRSNGPAQLSLVTNISNRDNKGAHSALIIDGPQRVVFNPSGTWTHPQAPEQGDLHYGLTPAMENWFIDYHARETYRVQVQRVTVAPEVAAEALRRAQATGTVGPSGCTISITRILQGLPGFEDMPVSLFPDSAAKAFAQVPGVETTIYVDDSPGDRRDLRDGATGAGNVQVVPEHGLAVAVPKDLSN